MLLLSPSLFRLRSEETETSRATMDLRRRTPSNSSLFASFRAFSDQWSAFIPDFLRMDLFCGEIQRLRLGAFDLSGCMAGGGGAGAATSGSTDPGK